MEGVSSPSTLFVLLDSTCSAILNTVKRLGGEKQIVRS
ncbi:hypothetical protein [Enterococcus phage 156]|uniref:Uncharacterized protein n=1 Tax=Enterococcus phage MDA2 TaxID=2816459 RepID=A0AAE7RFB9_9CAUD|nr:hypothetical protein [Enterococcus phage vB_EfaM_Ef2.1]QVW27916.1 hypothetical protein [Enterococcus phage MDA2]WDQ27645.1 hypothetical protein EF53_013 [Enterococcus phage 53]CAD0299709.1 hypothetical protein [Enterococcus phage 156]CAI9187517.1 hypothetical protein [Enterococcus phage Sw5]